MIGEEQKEASDNQLNREKVKFIFLVKTFLNKTNIDLQHFIYLARIKMFSFVCGIDIKPLKNIEQKK